jgi:hydrogenase expression/formation protein HypC
MCLGIPMRLLELNNNQMGRAETLGVCRKISLRLVPDAQVGDYLLVHAGFAIEKIDTEEAAEILTIFQEAIGDVDR